MEKSIKDAIEHLSSQKKRPSMEEIFNVIKRQDECLEMECFKEVFDDCLDREKIKKRRGKDSYYVEKDEEEEENKETKSYDESYDENNDKVRDIFLEKDVIAKEERDLMDIIRNNIYGEKSRQEGYIQELKDNIKFLKEELTTKNNQIFKLLAIIEDRKIVETRTEHCVNVAELYDAKKQFNDTRGNTINDVSIKNKRSRKNELIAMDANYTNHIEDNEHSDGENNNGVTNKVEIIGDSLLNGLIDDKLSRNNTIKTRKHSGCTTKDLKHHIMPTIDKKPKIIICHAGSNDLTNDIDTIENYQTIINRIKRKTPYTKIAISSVIKRFDHKNIEMKVVDLNMQLKKLCNDNLIDYIDNDNIDESCLSARKLHLINKGNAYLASNFIRYVKSKAQPNY